jgi:hypothetical protein
MKMLTVLVCSGVGCSVVAVVAFKASSKLLVVRAPCSAVL